MQLCPSCGQAFDPVTGVYADYGELVCGQCKRAEDVSIGDTRAGDQIVKVASLGLMFGAISILFNPVFVTSVVAIGLSVGSLFTLMRHPEYHEHLGAQVPSTIAFAFGGIALALMRPLFVLLVFW